LEPPSAGLIDGVFRFRAKTEQKPRQEQNLPELSASASP
jgi:hypothetical protein